jgi:hypothetical protein
VALLWRCPTPAANKDLIASMQSLLGCALLFPGVDCNFFYSVGPPCIFTHRLMKLQVLWTIPVQKKVGMTLQSFIFPIPWFFLSYKTGPRISE